MPEITLPTHWHFVDLTGHAPFDRLAVVSFAGMKDVGSTRQASWNCRCDCGNELVVLSNKLRSGHTRSCGCLAKDVRTNSHTTHGGSSLPEYRIWQNMKRRCDDETCREYKWYGARGIYYCDRWGDFANFLSDMGRRPAPNLTLEREDNSMGYSPENCVWATQKEQSRNTRSNVLLSFSGETKCVSEWAEIHKIDQSTVRLRLRLGWSVKDALTKPVRDSVMITFQGVTMCRDAWAKHLGIDRATFRKRLRNWTVAKAMTTPVDARYSR